jgi:hypothetical protein
MNALQKHLEDINVHVKFKLAALWTSTMFLYVYGDFFSLFVPGHIQKLMDGKSGVGTTTPFAILGFAVMMTIPSLMIFLSLTLPSNINRWANIISGFLFTLIMALILASSLREWWIFYSYLAVVEIALTSIIVWFAWKWKRQE